MSLKSAVLVLALLNAHLCGRSTTFGALLDWSYAIATQWRDLCANGTRQSPIDIKPNSAYYDSSLSRYPLKFVAHSGNLTGEYTNNGYTVQFSVNKTAHPVDSRPRITGAGLSGGLSGSMGYIFEQLHFHWGSGPNIFDGSEHAIDGRRTPMELHILYYNNKYFDFSDAVNFPDGIAAIGLQVAPTSDNNTEARSQADFSQLADFISQVADEDAKISATINLGHVIPKWARNNVANDTRPNNGTFYRYEGSWSTPPCYENVVFTIFRDPVLVPISTLAKFWRTTNRHVFNETTRQYVVGPLVNTFRPLQSSNQRVVRTNKLNATAGEQRIYSPAVNAGHAGTNSSAPSNSSSHKSSPASPERSTGQQCCLSNFLLLLFLFIATLPPYFP